VQSNIHLFTKLLFDFGVFRCGLQNTRAGHEDLVILLMPDSICLERLSSSEVDVSSVEMQIPGIDGYRSKSAGVAL
jgi:hypothetical protein